MISSHVICDIKLNEDGSLKLEKGIAPHENERDMKLLLVTFPTTCSPIGLRISE